MDKLERDVTRAAEQLAAKHGRCVFVLALEPDGINSHGVLHALHSTVNEDTTPTAYLLMQELNKHYINILHHFLGK